MHYYYISNFILLIQLGSRFSFAVVDDYFRFPGCEFSQQNVCNPDSVEDIKIINAGESQFKQCPKTSRVCTERNTRVDLSDSRLFVFDYGALQILDGGSVKITRNGICKIWGRGFVEVGKNATVTMDNGRLELESSGEIFNRGSLYIGNESFVHVTSHAQILTELVSRRLVSGNLAASSLHIDNKSIAKFNQYSRIAISSGSKLITVGNNKLQLYRHSSIDLDKADVVMANGSEFDISSYSSLEVGSVLCPVNVNKTTFSFGAKSKLQLSEKSSIYLRSGQLILDDNAIVTIDSRAEVFIQGLLQIRAARSVQINYRQRLIIGHDSLNLNYTLKYDPCTTDSSLIIIKDDVLPMTLSVFKGAHCFTKPTGNYSREFNTKSSVELMDDSDTNEFKCFKSRDELMNAVKYI